MRTTHRSNKQLKITSKTRESIFDFMRQFHAVQMWTINGPMHTACDEIICFTWYYPTLNEHRLYPIGGTVMVQTWVDGGWSIYGELNDKHDVIRDALAAHDKALH